MKTIQKQLKIWSLVILMCVGIRNTAFSQDPNGNGGDPSQSDAPIDGGLSILLAAGIGYGVKKAYGKGKKIKLDEPQDVSTK